MEEDNAPISNEKNYNEPETTDEESEEVPSPTDEESEQVPLTTDDEKLPTDDERVPTDDERVPTPLATGDERIQEQAYVSEPEPLEDVEDEQEPQYYGDEAATDEEKEPPVDDQVEEITEEKKEEKPAGKKAEKKKEESPEEEEDEVEEVVELTEADILRQKREKAREERLEERRKKIVYVKENLIPLDDPSRDVEHHLKVKPVQDDTPAPELTPEELKDHVERKLSTNNLYVTTDRVMFDFQARTFKKIIDNTREVPLYELEGCIVWKNADAYKEQLKREMWQLKWEQDLIDMNKTHKESIKKAAQKLKNLKKLKGKKSKTVIAEQPVEEPKKNIKKELIKRQKDKALLFKRFVKERKAADPESKDEDIRFLLTSEIYDQIPKKKLLNRFNFNERSTLTVDSVYRDKMSQTEENPRYNFVGQVSQWIIYDHYKKDYDAAEAIKEKERLAKMMTVAKKEDRAPKNLEKQEDPIYKRMVEDIKILERMLNQNSYDTIAQDCYFYEDPADKYRTDEGVLLPLWEFKYTAAKHTCVAQVTWNPAYKDLFGVAFGSLESNQGFDFGAMAVFTLKNPSFPEFVTHFDTGVMCLDFHPKLCYYICVGLKDGSVMVCNMQTQNLNRFHQSDCKSSHRSVVWNVFWCDDSREKELTFFSAGGDGRVCKWLVLHNELLHTPILTLFYDIKSENLPKSLTIETYLTCLTFHPKNFEIFMVGSAFGRIYKCNISYASTYYYHMEAHSLQVSQISINKYIPDIFITASYDWRIKIWEDGRPEPYFVYNMDAAVQDVQWAPYSSTVFAALNATGMVHIYDLNINKYEPTCAQYVICQNDNVATCLSFNPTGQNMPLLLVGDSRGIITTLKISPNLRQEEKLPKKVPEGQPVSTVEELEIKKFEKIMEYVREPFIIKVVTNDESQPVMPDISHLEG